MKTEKETVKELGSRIVKEMVEGVTEMLESGELSKTSSMPTQQLSTRPNALDLIRAKGPRDDQPRPMTPDPKPEVPTLKLRKPEEIIITAADQNLCLGSGELKRCPFCGAHAMSSGERTANGRAIRWTIQCTGSKGCIPNCFASVIGVDPDQSTARRVAVERWNRRADSRLERENAELTNLLKQCLEKLWHTDKATVEAVRAAIKSATGEAP